jgi:glycerol-3-phosphate acyltransferase PlsY
MLFTIIVFVIALVCAYIIGSIPTGYWLAKQLKGIDIRQMGSGSTGATNVYRCVGKAAGISVFVIDFLKGYLPVVFAAGISMSATYMSIDHIWRPTDVYKLFPVFIAASVLVGHSRSIFLDFKGGKSAATGLGTLFALDFRVGLFTFITWITVLYLGKIVSIASILATASCIPYMILFKGPPAYIVYCILGFIYVAFRHKENIKRILAGKEPKIGNIGSAKDAGSR